MDAPLSVFLDTEIFHLRFSRKFYTMFKSSFTVLVIFCGFLQLFLAMLSQFLDKFNNIHFYTNNFTFKSQLSRAVARKLDKIAPVFFLLENTAFNSLKHCKISVLLPTRQQNYRRSNHVTLKLSQSHTSNFQTRFSPTSCAPIAIKTKLRQSRFCALFPPVPSVSLCHLPFPRYRRKTDQNSTFANNNFSIFTPKIIFQLQYLNNLSQMIKASFKAIVRNQKLFTSH